MWYLSVLIILLSISGFTHSYNMTGSLRGSFDTILSIVDKLEVPTNPIGTSHLNSSELIAHYGFTPEEHWVKTSDGFTLGMFRIRQKGPPVLVFHGLTSSSDDYMGLGYDSLPFVLAAKGYDVWLPNARGNLYSKKNDKFIPEEFIYWEFTWNEIGIYDLPVVIDYCLEKTGASKLSYIGHSQGTTSVYVLLSELPEYNDKLNAVISLAPIAFMQNVASPLVQALAEIRLDITIAFKALLIYTLGTHDPPYTTVLSFCGSSSLLSAICHTFMGPIYGFSYSGIDYQHTETQFNHLSGGSSLLQGLHFLQNVKTKLFQKYDYGPVQNLLKYETASAPSYQLKKIVAPMIFFYSNNDWLASPKDVTHLIKNLPKKPETYVVSRQTFNHMDFIWAKDANKLVYSNVVKVLNKYNNYSKTTAKSWF